MLVSHLLPGLPALLRRAVTFMKNRALLGLLLVGGLLFTTSERMAGQLPGDNGPVPQVPRFPPHTPVVPLSQMPRFPPLPSVTNPQGGTRFDQGKEPIWLGKTLFFTANDGVTGNELCAPARGRRSA